MNTFRSRYLQALKTLEDLHISALELECGLEVEDALTGAGIPFTEEEFQATTQFVKDWILTTGWLKPNELMEYFIDGIKEHEAYTLDQVLTYEGQSDITDWINSRI